MDEAQFLEELKKDFFNEAQTLIESLEENILIIEKDPTNSEAINEIFRAAHTIKGGSSTLDLDRIAHFTHEMENLLDEVRGGKIKLNPNLVDLLLKSIDIVKKLVNDSQNGVQTPEGIETEIIATLKSTSEGAPVEFTPKKSPQQRKSTPQHTIPLNEYERYLIKKAPTEGYNIFNVYVHFDSKNPMKTVSGLQIHSQLKEIAEILKSDPDIDDLMGDQFYEEAIFIVQSNGTKDEIYRKVFLSDVTLKVEVDDYTDEIEEPHPEDKHQDSNLQLNSQDLQEIQTNLLQGKNVFKVIVRFDEDNPMRSVSGVLFYTMLRNKGTVLKSLPTYDDFKKDTFYPYSEIIFSTTSDVKELKNKLYLSDVTKELKFQEFKKDATAAPQIIAPEIKPQESQPVQTKIITPQVQEQQQDESKETQQVESQIDTSGKSDRKQTTSVLRVESARIDDMLNLVGELVIIKASFVQLNDHSTSALDNLISSYNQYRIQLRQMTNDLNDFLESQSPDNNHQMPIPNSNSHNIEYIKEFIKEKLQILTTHFDSILPQYKNIQEKLKSSSQGLGRITDDLQESVMKVRMVPISQIFSRFPRLVRDISRNLQKKINLIMEGEETELDKSVIEDLVDPLIHIVRNAVDHGIEPETERIQNGKDPSGNILLKADHEGNTVNIIVKDDGRGLNLTKIREKAIANNLIEPNSELSKSQLINLIFEPGFSTASQVTSLSGRGVGMDVVRKKIENIGGIVEIESEETKGSTFRIKIPLTLAIIQALLVQVKDYVYSIPINSVIETLRVGPEDIETLEKTEVIRVRDEVLSIVHLDFLFKHRKGRRDDESFYVIIVGTSGKKVGLGVDNLIGEQDIVIKPLNNKYTNVKGIAGATILGDGQVSLVVDVVGVFNLISDHRKYLVTTAV